MSESEYILALDVGTTQAKAVIFDGEDRVVARAGRRLAINNLKTGWVEQDPGDLWRAAQEVMVQAIDELGGDLKTIAGMGLTCQRETVIAWNKQSGKPIYPAISWGDSRTREECGRIRASEGSLIKEKTGLPVETYFSATKMSWILEQVEEAKVLLKAGELAMGTVDTWLLRNLTGGKSFLTDYTNAARTLLFNIKTRGWDEELTRLFRIPEGILPEPVASIGAYGMMEGNIVGLQIPIFAVCGDQQASLWAAGEEKGKTKITYGTGTFVMQVAGDEFELRDGFYTTLTAGGGFALEAKIDRGGREVDELLDKPEELKIFLRELAVDVNAYIQRLPYRPREIVIDGGVMRDGLLKDIQAEITGLPIREQIIFDGTALGAARLARAGLVSTKKLF